MAGDPIRMAIALLSANGDVTSLVGSNIYGGILPEGYHPHDSGPAIVVTVKGGITDTETPIQHASVQVTCWDDVNGFVRAHTVYEAVFACLHGVNNINFGANGRLLSVLEEAIGQDVVDPDMGWAEVIAAFTFQMFAGTTSITDPITPTQSAKEYIDSLFAAVAGMDDNL